MVADPLKKTGVEINIEEISREINDSKI